MPNTDRNGLSISGERGARPGRELAPVRPAAVTFSIEPAQPPTRASPATVSGMSSARITKNCSTSL